MRRADLKIGTKMYVGFFMFVLIFTLSAGYQISNVLRLGKMQAAGAASAKDALHLAEKETNLQEVYGMIADAVINRDIKKFKAAWMDHRKKIIMDLDEIKKRAETAAEKEWAGKIAEGYDKYFALIKNELLPLLEKKAGLDEIAKINAKIDTIREGLDKFLGDFSKSISNKSDATNKHFDEVYSSSVRIAWVMSGMGIMLASLLAFFLTRSITGPLNRVITGLTDSADQVASAANQVSSTSQSLAEGTTEQAASLEETSASLEEMSSITKQNADHTNLARSMMREANLIVEKVNRHMTDMSGAIAEITRSSEETGKIIKTIDEIAFQTNLLALNAAVEAARAGEAGAGFAVVADEVRSLALRASESAKNTSNLIESTIKAVRNGNELTSATREAFRENAEISRKIGQLVDEIATASEEQARGISQVDKAVQEMERVMQSTAANAEESAAAAEELNAQAEQMQGFVEELAAVIGSSGEGQRSIAPLPRPGQRSGKRRAAPALPRKTAGREMAVPGRGNMKVTRPDQIIPLEDGDFKDF